MKPILRINQKQRRSRCDIRARRGHHSFPLTDYNYRSTAKTQFSPVGAPATKAPAFHRLSSEFLGRETRRDYFGELLFFILITGVAAWPIMSMLIAVLRMIRNY
jgi:hypothetical protein